MRTHRYVAAVLAAAVLCSCGEGTEPAPSSGFSLEIAGASSGAVRGDSGRYGPNHVGTLASTGHQLFLEPVTGSPAWLRAEQVMIELDNGGYPGPITGVRPIGVVGLSTGTARASLQVIGSGAYLSADSGTVSIAQHGPRRVRGSVDVWVSGVPGGGAELGPLHLMGSFVADSSIPDLASDDLAELNARVMALIGDARCVSVGQCRTIAFGSKPCGGPWRYLVYSTAVTDSVQLAAAVAAYNAREAELNVAEGRVSDCSVPARPRLGVVNGRCVALP